MKDLFFTFSKSFRTVVYGLLCLLFLNTQSAFAIMEVPQNNGLSDATLRQYRQSTKDERLIRAAEALKGTLGDYSRRAILGENLTGKPIKVEFKDLSEFNPAYADFDALGWKNRGRLNIFINKKHQNAPKEALAAVLAHEAIHQDELNSLNEETYCWTLEAAVWTQLTEDNPSLENISHVLVDRENTIKRLFVKGGYTKKYIRKSVISNAGYQNLPSRSPGFEDDNSNDYVNGRPLPNFNQPQTPPNANPPQDL